MYSDIFLSATVISSVFAQAALIPESPTAPAAVAAMLLFLALSKDNLAVLPYVGVHFHRLPQVVLICNACGIGSLA